MKSLIKQGIRRVTLREHGTHHVLIRCRKQDVKIAEEASKIAVDEFHKEQKELEQKLKQEAKARGGRYDQPLALEIKPKIEREDYVPMDNAGGVTVSAHSDTVVCDNTLGKRLEIAEYALTPQLRHILFPSLRSKTIPKSRETANSEETDLLA